MTGDIHVMRLGGSLFALPDLRDRLRRVRQSGETPRLWIAGTGAWGDQLRHAQSRLDLSDEACHRIGIRLMSASAMLTSEALDGASIVDRTDDVENLVTPGGQTDVVFDVARILLDDLPPPVRRLPRDWRTTSDAIAACVAELTGARTLTLLKSCTAPSSGDVQDWSRRGLVDEAFPQALPAGVEVRWINLAVDVAVG